MITVPDQFSGVRSNAISSRITSVLSASYSDLDIRDALEILDKRQFKNTQESRRQVRLDVQEEVIRRNGEILEDFGSVAEELKKIDALLTNIKRCCTDMQERIRSANEESTPVLEEAASLMSQKSQVETKSALLSAFNSHFLLSDSELAALTSSSEPVDDAFFAALAKAKRIHADTEVLLGSSNERMGRDVLEQSSKTLDNAFQKLFRWIQKAFRTLDLENPQLSAPIRGALRVLAERPALFQSCMDFFAETREQTLSESFQAALTGRASAGENDSAEVKPIEFHAHDPLRYISDMLAWVHSATVSEREALEALFIGEGEELAKGIKEGINNDPWSRYEGLGDHPFDSLKELNSLVSRDVAGVARLLRHRTEQVIQGHDEATLSYRIANLIAFYEATFGKLLGSDADILETFLTLKSSAERQFNASMKDSAMAIQNEVVSTTPSQDASPPEFLEESLQTLKALMMSYDTSLATVSSDPEGFNAVFAVALDPFMEACHTLGQKLKEPTNDIFAINCLLSIKTVLSSFSFAANKLDSVNTTLAIHASNLMRHQHERLLRNSGLEPLVAALTSSSSPPDNDDSDNNNNNNNSTHHPPSSSPSSLAALRSLSFLRDPATLLDMARSLDAFLPSALMDALDHVKPLRNARLARDITDRAAERFCEDFEAVEEKLVALDEMTMDERKRWKYAAGGGVDDDDDDDDDDSSSSSSDDAYGTKSLLRDLFPRTSSEIRVLLS